MKLHPQRLGRWSILALTLAASAAHAIPTRNVQVLANRNDYPPGAGSPFGAGYASCWSYVHGDGREYALIGTTNGVAIYNVTDPANVHFVKLIGGPNSAWREMKSYRNWVYVVTEGGGAPYTPGMQIIRMTDPENPVLATTYTTNFQTAHTVSVDTTRAILVCNGTRYLDGTGNAYAAGMRILSLANPEAPVELGWWPGGSLPVTTTNYVHDSVPIGNRLYAASVYVGTQRVIDITDPAAPTQVASWTYPNAFYTHNCWPDATGDHLYVTDEQNGQTLRVFDISNLAAPQLTYEYTPNPMAIVHNAHVLGNELYLANYTEGIRVLDLSDPARPAEFAWADTYPGTSGGYSGVWGICPYFPSGTVIASDMQTGLWVFRVNRDYGLLKVRVVDAATSDPIAGVVVRLTSQGDSLVTPADGIVQFAPSPGSHTVEVASFGYDPVSAISTITAGGRDSITLALDARPTADIHGTVSDANTAALLQDAEVLLAYTPLDQLTDATGAYHLHEVPQGSYGVEVRRPGYAPLVFPQSFGPGPIDADYRLRPVRSWDDAEIDRGWSLVATGDNSAYGRWVRGIPSVATGAEAAARARGPMPLEPEHEGEPELPAGINPTTDRTPPPGTRCYMTGAGGTANVRTGKTTLTSPTLDATGLADPVIGYWRWFYSNGDADDWLAVLISNNNGTTWTVVDTTRGIQNAWRERAIHVANYLPPTNQMKVRFVAGEFGYASLVEVAIDDVSIYDGAATPVGVDPAPPPARLGFRAPWPNPSSGTVQLALAVPATGAVDVDVIDLAGRVVRSLHRGTAAAGPLALRWDGTDASGRLTAAGIYYARARSGGETARVRFARVR